MRSRTLIGHLAAEHSRAKRAGVSPNPDRIAELHDQIREAQLAEWVERQLAAAPPLSQATRDKLAALLSGGDGHVPAAR